MAASDTIEAEGHLIDSGNFQSILTTIVEHGSEYEILRFDIGRTNDDASRIQMRLTAETLIIANGGMGAGIEKLNWLRPVKPGDDLRIEITVKVGDYFAQKRNADFYQVAFDRSTLEDLGFTLVWSNPDWYLWRIP